MVGYDVDSRSLRYFERKLVLDISHHLICRQNLATTLYESEQHSENLINLVQVSFAKEDEERMKFLDSILKGSK